MWGGGGGGRSASGGLKSERWIVRQTYRQTQAYLQTNIHTDCSILGAGGGGGVAVLQRIFLSV